MLLQTLSVPSAVQETAGGSVCQGLALAASRQAFGFWALKGSPQVWRGDLVQD